MIKEEIDYSIFNGRNILVVTKVGRFYTLHDVNVSGGQIFGFDKYNKPTLLSTSTIAEINLASEKKHGN